jgi:glycosyltransferase involved in cell wall biosynthesis
MTNLPEQKPRVSVCVPTYNGEDYLVECLDSIRAQTFTDFEVIIVDDESTDRSYEIAQGYAKLDSRFRVQRNAKRLGLVGNWNHCLDVSRGEWIKLLFQDDLLESRCIERLLAVCERFQTPFGFCHREVIFGEQTPSATQEFFIGHQQLLWELHGTKDSRVEPEAFARMAVQRLDRNLVGEPTVTLFRRSLAQQYGMFLPAMIQKCDSEYWTRLATNIGVAHVAEPLATFRVHGKSTTSQNLARREYGTRLLDPLIEHYLYLHEKHYAAMRLELFRASGRLVNWWRLVWSAHNAWHKAVATPGNPELLQQWQAATKAYPRFKRLALAGRFLTKIRSLLAATGLDRRFKRRD